MAVGADLGLGISQNPSSPILFNDNRRKRWSDEMLELMLGHVANVQQRRHQTLDLLGTFSSQHHPLQNPVPCGWERCLDLQTGYVYYVNSKTGTRTSADPSSPLVNDLNSTPSSSSSSSNSSSSSLHNTNTRSPSPDLTNLDLNLRLASPHEKPKPELCHPSSSRLFFSSHDSMVTFQAADANYGENLIREEVCGSGEEVGPDMVALGCRKCLMYVMLSSVDPRCPRCGTSALLDIPQSKRTKLIHTI